MPSAIEIIRARMQNTRIDNKEEIIENKTNAETLISEPEIKPADDVIINEVKINSDTPIMANDKPLVEVSETDAEPVKKKRRRTKKSESTVVEEPEKINTSDAVVDVVSYANTNVELEHIDKVDIEPILSSPSEITEKLETMQPFDFNHMHWTPHKYKIGDTVWVPVDEQVTNDSMYDPIKVVLKKVPKKFTIATVSITNKVCYTFKETSKVIAHEKFVCDTKEICEEICKEFN